MGDSVRDADPSGASLPPARQVARTLAMSVVVDGRLGGVRAHEVARLVARLGLQGAWLRQPWWPTVARGATDAGGASEAASTADHADVLARLAAAAAPAPVGLVVDTDTADGGWLDALVSAVPAGSAEGSAEPAWPGGARIALAGTPQAVAMWRRWISERPALAGTGLALPAGEVIRSPVGGRASANPVAPGAVFVPLRQGRNLVAAVTEAAAVAAGRPVLVEITVSVGRTAAEARARAESEELFSVAGHPVREGLFGTLEECQAAASALAHAGATELVCYLPRTGDLPDVLAQLRAIAIGAGVLRPGEPPSDPPPPPVGWGGRRGTR